MGWSKHHRDQRAFAALEEAARVEMAKGSLTWGARADLARRFEGPTASRPTLYRWLAEIAGPIRRPFHGRAPVEAPAPAPAPIPMLPVVRPVPDLPLFQTHAANPTQPGPLVAKQEPPMSNVIPFSFNGAAVRVINRAGDPWFVLADVCRVMEIANSGNAANRLDDDEKGIHSADTLGGRQDMVIISEPGLYRLVLRSDKPQAKPFQKWVAGTVLPSIRKTGSYALPAPANDEELLGRALLIAHGKMKQLEERAYVAEGKVQTLLPMAEAHQRLEASAGCMCITDAGKILGLGQQATHRLMHAHGYIYRRPGSRYWLGYEVKIKAEMIEHRHEPYTTPDGEEKIKPQVMVTPKGIAALAKLLQPKKRAA